MSDNETTQVEDSSETTDRNELRKRAAKKAEVTEAQKAAATVVAVSKDPSKYAYYVSSHSTLRSLELTTLPLGTKTKNICAGAYPQN
jgi:hypothetical protein